MCDTDSCDGISVVAGLYSIRRTIERNSPNSREKSLALTKIDEACMWYKQIPIVMEEEKETDR